MAQKKSGVSRTHAFVFLAVLFIIILIIGHFFIQHLNSPSPSQALQTATSSSHTNSTISSKPESTASISTLTPLQSQAISECATALQKTTTDQKTDYQKGTILIRFSNNISLQDAEGILHVYGVGVYDQKTADANYSTNHILTVSVPVGQEFKKICTLKQDSNIKYAGLNVIFSLHE